MRLKMFRLGTDMLLDLLRGRVTRVDFGVPPGAKVLAVDYNHSCRAFDIAVEHDSFDPVPPMHLIPLSEQFTALVLNEGPDGIERWDKLERC